MNEQELDALMAESTKQFNQLKVEEGTVKVRLEQIDTGMKQLQGEYSAYETLKKALVERAQQSAGNTAQSALPEASEPAALTPDPFRSKDEAKKEHANASK